MNSIYRTAIETGNNKQRGLRFALTCTDDQASQTHVQNRIADHI